VRAVAADRGAELFERGAYRVQGKSDDFSYSFRDHALRGLATGLPGDHQVDNAGVALTVADLLPDPFRPSDDAIRRGLRMARNPGRNEWLAPDLLIDCAHNADGAAQLAAYLRQLPRDRRRTLLLGVSKDKDVRAIVAALAPAVDRVICTRCSHPRAADPKELAQTLVDIDVPVSAAGPIEDALPRALGEGGLVIAAGSVFLAGAVRDILGAR
jgi:dihydrofolate synthase/folylpolyglutamate synthase